MDRSKEEPHAMIEAYDDEAEATGWYGPEAAFGLTYAYVQPGQSILDIGIGTGLGSVLFHKAGLKVYGMDVSQKMLDTCRSKGLTNLKLHDLKSTPYPYDAGCMDHAVCVGVLNFFSDLWTVFEEIARILRMGGLFVFVVGDRTGDESHEFMVGVEHTKANPPVTMYRHTARQVDDWVKKSGFSLLRSLAFTVYMDRERTRSLKAKAYLARKTGVLNNF
jgi:predicted TPR repeat methyltransferase